MITKEKNIIEKIHKSLTGQKNHTKTILLTALFKIRKKLKGDKIKSVTDCSVQKREKTEKLKKLNPLLTAQFKKV